MRNPLIASIALMLTVAMAYGVTPNSLAGSPAKAETRPVPPVDIPPRLVVQAGSDFTVNGHRYWIWQVMTVDTYHPPGGQKNQPSPIRRWKR